MILDNSLDERYYSSSVAENQLNDVPKMRDPHDMIYFFKTEIQMTI
jgi:hypothetical protein